MPFKLEDIETLPNDLAHYRDTVLEMIELSPVKEGVSYLTIDEKIVTKGNALRLKGLHVDGVGADGRQDYGIWAIVGIRRYVANLWDEGLTKWMYGAAGIGGMITVSNPAGCRAWYKDFTGTVRNNGDCEKLRNLFPESESTVFEPNMVYWCSAMCVHESLPMEADTERTFVRLSMPSKAPWYEGYTRNPKGVEPAGVTIGDGWNQCSDRVLEPEVVLNG